MDPPDEWLPPSDVLDALEAEVVEFGAKVVWRAIAHRQGQTSEDITPEIVLRPSVVRARWNPRGVSALYTALDRATAAAEGAQLRQNQHDEGTLTSMTMELVPLEVHLERVVDIRGTLAGLGLHEQELGGPVRTDIDEPTLAQRVGAGVWYLGYAGLVVPSLQRWPEPNLVIFPDRLGPSDYYVPHQEGPPGDRDELE